MAQCIRALPVKAWGPEDVAVWVPWPQPCEGQSHLSSRFCERVCLGGRRQSEESRTHNTAHIAGTGDREWRAGHTTQHTLLELETERGGQDTQHNAHCWNWVIRAGHTTQCALLELTPEASWRSFGIFTRAFKKDSHKGRLVFITEGKEEHRDWSQVSWWLKTWVGNAYLKYNWVPH